MSNHRGRARPEDQEFDLRWWPVPAVLALLVVAAVLARPDLDRRNAVQHAAAPQEMAEPARHGTPAPGTAAQETLTEEDNHAPTF